MSDGSRKRGPNCPICGRPTEQRFRPFCSRRCADVDLGKWLGGEYAIPSDAEWDDDDLPTGSDDDSTLH